MIYDSFAMFDSYTLRKNLKHLSLAKQLYIFARKKSGLLFHHAILFFGGYPLVLVCSRNKKNDIACSYRPMQF
jgi:hypothetical protein